jgi:hypothetical protein
VGSILLTRAVQQGSFGERAAFGSVRVEAGRCFFAGERPALLLAPAVYNVVSTQVLVNLIVSERMDFTEATDRLTKGVSLAHLAQELDASYGLIRQARMDPSSRSYRRPPEGWQSAVARLAEERAQELLALKNALERP